MDDQPPRLRDQTGVRLTLRIGGAICLVAGIVFIALAIAGFVHSDNSNSFSTAAPKHFWFFFVGGPLLVLGLGMLAAGFMGAATRYAAGEVMPTVKDSVGYVGRRCARRWMCTAGHPNPPGSGVCVVCGKPVIPR